MNATNEQICNLLPLYYEGKLNAEQCRIVENWIAMSAANRHIAQQIETIYRATDTLYALDKAETGKALKEIHKKMEIRKDFHIWTWAQRIAAILFIPLLIASLMQYLASDKKQTVETVKMISAPGMITSTMLPDGTEVMLNSNSSISYPSYFGNDSRNVQIDGEAYFKVTKDARRPFIVETPQKAAIRVYGTCFNIEAYAADKDIKATLVNGSISMSYKDKNNRWNERKIVPGEKITYSAAQGNVQVEKTDVDVTTSWKDDKLIFHNTPFAEVLKTLSKRYNVEFIVKNPQCYKSSITGVLEKQHLERILEYFSISSNIHFSYQGNNDIRQEKQIIEVY